MTMRWRGLMAPIDAQTGDRRMFAPGAIGHRRLPLPAKWQKVQAAGHQGAVTVASIDSIYQVGDDMWGAGEILDPMVIPEVIPFTYLANKGLVGPSVDLEPNITYTTIADPDNPDETVMKILRGTVSGTTFVSTPAFSQVTLEVFDDGEAATLLASAGVECFAVNSRSWRSWPMAEKDTKWSVDDTLARLSAWAGGDAKKYAQAFLYYDAKGRADIRETYRLPIADVINDRLVLIPRAVYQAAAFLSGAHGGVKEIPDSEVQPLQRVVTEIYAVLAEEFQDPDLRPPWQRGGRQGATDAGALSIMKEVVMDDEAENTFAVRSSGWSDLPTSTGIWDEGAARAALDAWAGDDMDKYAKAFLWNDDSGNKTGMKFPIAKPVNGKLTIFIRAVNNAKSRLSSASIPAADKARILTILNGIQERYDGQRSSDEMALLASGSPIRPPKEWFDNPHFTKPTQFTVTEEGRVYGHLAAWNTCHKAFRHKCVLPPRSATNYRHFRLGRVLCDDGSQVPVGRVTVGTGHADDTFGVIPAREHYDNTGTCAAIVAVYEDKFGIAFAGCTVPDLPEAKVAELRRSPLSGDWRRSGGNLELVGALAVNDPGFEVVGEDELGVYSLTAAGVVYDEGGDCGCAVTVPDLPVAGGAEVLADVDALLARLDADAKIAAYNTIMAEV